MKKAKLSHLFGLVVLAALILGCTPMISPPTPTPSPTQPLPTSTPITPTNTPAPTDTPAPTLTFTPVPTQSLSSMIQALIPATLGNGVADAAAYDPSKPGTHPIIVISATDQVGWNDSLPESWQPSNVGQVELVAVLNNSKTQIDVKEYLRVGFIRSYRIDTEVVLREAKTGKMLALTVFQGDNPPPLAHQLPAGTQALYGATVQYQTVQLWLQSFIEK
jgi:hypothetical protein